MWNRISGKKNGATDDSTPQTPRRKDEDDSIRRRSGSVISSDSKKKSLNNTDDRDRGFNPTSTAYSSTSRVAYPNTAGASVASSHATASANGNDESYTTPVLNRNQSLADKMPKSTSSTRSGRDSNEDGDRKSKISTKSSRDEDDGKREKKSKRDKTERKSSLKNGGTSQSRNGMDEGTSKGPADFPSQVGSSGFQQFPGQYDGGVFESPSGDQNGTSRPPEHESMSSHVQDQFPGQFPSQSAEPYRPPLAASEGGPGLAADYYGDAGQSVAEQPGFRQDSPSLIIGQEPHLLPASSVAAPPPEPSASGGVGAAASFFSGDFEADETTSSHAQQASSTYTSAPSRPNMPANSSSLPSLGGAAMGATAAMGAAAGYMMGNHSSSAQQHDTVSAAGTASEYVTTSSQRPPSQSQGSYYSSTSRPPTSGDRPSHADNTPIYAATAAAGVAGLAGSAMHSSHYTSDGHGSSNQQYATPTTPRHRHRGPFGALVDFVKDPEGVAQFEEYSEYVGICRGCFEPGSSPRDAPRRHRTFNRKRSNERIGRTSRVEKTRLDGSDDERRRRNSPSWLATGLAGYGLGKMGEGLFKQTKNFDDTYSVKLGRFSPEGGRKHRERRESDTEFYRQRRSQDQFESGINGDGKVYEKNSNGFGAPTTSIHTTRRRSGSRSRDRKSSLAGPALGTAAGASVIGSSYHRRSHSGDRGTVKSKHKSRDGPPSEHRQRSHKKKKEKGFFSHGSNSSSSSLDSAHHRSSKMSRGKSDSRKAEAALLGLGAAAAALAVADGRSGHRKNGIKELVGRKETKHDRYPRPSAEDAGWEDEEDYVSELGSVDSGLAFGGDSDGSQGRKRDRRRRSDMSGKGSLPGRRSSWDDGLPAMTGAVGAGIVASEAMSPDHYDLSSRHDGPSPPLRYVDPMPVSDFAHLDERMETSEPFPSRPPLVTRPSNDSPFHQPQPIAPISSSVYATQVPRSQTYPSTAGPTTYTSPPFGPQNSIPGEFCNAREAPDSERDLKLSRRDTSPARFGPDDTPTDLTYRRKPSAKDDSSAVSGVRFALPEKDEEERREKRRRRKDSEKDNPLIKEDRPRDNESERSGERSPRKSLGEQSKRSDSPIDSSTNLWTVPVAVGLAGAAVGAAAITESRNDSKEEETKEERRERRRRERRRDDEEDEARRERRRRDKDGDLEDTPSKNERGRDDDHEETREERKARRRRQREEREREREREEEVAKPKISHVSFGDLPDRSDRSSEDRSQPERQESPSRTESYKHEDYSSFFTPAIDENDDQQAKISGANADADISFDQSPNFVIAEPRGLYDLSANPDFSPADTNDKVDPNILKFPWQVPRLRLLYPTPPPSRGSTPIMKPRDAHEKDLKDLEDPPEVTSSGASSSKVASANDPINEYEVSRAEPREVADRFRDPPSDDDRERLERRKPKKIPLSIGLEDSTKEPASYSNDKNFAAVLAASAEDAGFDPSIVTSNPTYRRRDSPPGSDDRHMPGSFDDEDDELRPKPGKKKERSSRRQSPAEERNGDAVVEDIISQVGSSEPGEAREDPEANSDEFDTPKSRKSKKSKKGSKRSSTYDEASENQDPVAPDNQDKSRPLYEEPIEDAQSVTTSTALSKDGDGRKKSKKSKRVGETFGEAASAAAVASAVEAGKDSKKSGKKGSIWGRVLGKSTISLPETGETKDVKEEEPSELSRKDSKKAKKSKRNSTQSISDGDNEMRDDDTRDSSKRESEFSRSTILPAGSVAQYLTEDSDPEQSQEQVSESFLGERPDPPPPPDISDRLEEPPGTLASSTSRETGRNTSPEIFSRRPSEIRTSDIPPSPKAVSSSTVEPIHHRRPVLSHARSTSQSPLSSAQNADDVPQPSRPRARSTDLENSKEHWPLWLVEPDQSHQEVPRNETYPPLPSSHSTSRNSSPHSPDRHYDFEMAERGTFEPVEGDQGLMIDTGGRAMQLELLDSQQATLAASSFQPTSETRGQTSPLDSRSASPSQVTDAHVKQESSTLKHATLAAVIGETTAYTFYKAGEHNNSSDQHLPEESKDLRESLNEMAPDTQKAKPTTLDYQADFNPQKKEKSKDKKPKRHATEDFAEEMPSLETAVGTEDSAQPALPMQKEEAEGLTRGMPAHEVVNVMTSAAQDPDPTTDIASKSVRTDSMDTIEAAPERTDREKSKTKGGGSLADSDKPLDDKPIAQEEARDGKPVTPTWDVDFKDPFEEPSNEHGKDVEVSPMATPSPEDGDLDLLDETSRSDVKDSAKSSVPDVTMPQEKTVAPRAGNEQAAADDYFGAPIGKGKGEREWKQGLPEDDLIDFEPPVKSAFDTAEPVEKQQAEQGQVAKPAAVPLGGSRKPEEDFAGFGTKKKGKKGKKAKQSIQNEDLFEPPKSREAEEITVPRKPGAVKTDQPQQDYAAETEPEAESTTRKGTKTPEVTISLQNTQEAEDDFEGFSNKNRSKDKKDGKKSERLFDDPEQPELEQAQSQGVDNEAIKNLPAVDSHFEDRSVQGDRQINSTKESSRDAYMEPSLQEEEPYEPCESYSKKKKGKKSKKRDQIDLAGEEDDLLRAITSTSQDVQDILNESHAVTIHNSTPKEPELIDRALHIDQPVDSGGNTEWFRKHDASPSFTEHNHGAEAIGATIAATGTATAVHEILHEHDRPPTPAGDQDLDTRREPDQQSFAKLAEDNDLEPPTPAKKEQKSTQAEAISFDGPKGPEPINTPKPVDPEPSADAVAEDEDFGGLPLKKSKKDKKSKKTMKGEKLTFDEPEATEPAETSATVPDAADKASKAAEEEGFGSFATKTSKKDKKNKKNKKNGLSRSMSEGLAEERLDDVAPTEAEPLAEVRAIDAEPDTLESNEAPAPLPEATDLAPKEAQEDEYAGVFVKKSKKDKKNKKKGLSRTTSGVQTPEVVDEPTYDTVRPLPETNELVDSRIVQQETSAHLPEVLEPSAIFEPAKQIEQAKERQKEELDVEAAAIPKNKKDRKKPKKAKAFAWEDEPIQTADGENTIVATEMPGGNGLVDSLDTKLTDSADASGQISNAEEARGTQQEGDFAPPKSKKDEENARKAKDFSWVTYEPEGPEEDPLIVSQEIEDRQCAQEPSNVGILAAKAPKEEVESRVDLIKTDATPGNEELIRERENGDANLDNPNEAGVEPSLKLKKSKKDKRKSKKAQALSWDDDDLGENEYAKFDETPDLERIESSFHVKADAIETPGSEHNEPSFSEAAPATEPVISSVQGPRDVPEHLTFNDIIEPSAVVEPRKQHDQEELPPTASEGSATREAVEAESEEDLTSVKKSKKGRKSKKSRTLSFRPEDVEPVSHKQEGPNGQEVGPEEDYVLIVEGHRAHTPNDPEYEAVEERPAKKSVQINAVEPEIIEDLQGDPFGERPHEQPAQPETPLSAGSVEMLDPEEQREYNEEYRKQLEKELSPLRVDDGPLDTEEQREYNEEYRKELERQLSPSRTTDEITLPADLTDDQDMPRPSVIDEVVEQPIPSPKQVTPHHTVLSDIIEEKEPRSRSDSLQEPSAEGNDGLERKRSKKGKKSKKSRQPVIWEDDTATPGFAGGVEPPADDQQPSSRPTELEEPIGGDRAVYRDLPSPTRGSPSASRSPKFDDNAEDYFAVKPRAQAEQDIGRDAELHHHRSISPEQTHDLPDWSSQPKDHTLVVHDGGPPTTEQKRPPRERSPSRECRPRAKASSQEQAQERTSILQDERSVGRERSGTVWEIATAVAVGAGIVGAAELSRKESKGKDKKDKKSEKAKRRVDAEDEEEKPDQDEAPRDVIEHSHPVEKMDGMPRQFDDTPPQSPNRSASLQHSREESQQREDPKYRDSAIQIVDSPVVPGPEPLHRPQHDSGYPATEASPMVNDYDRDGREEREIIDHYTDTRVTSAGFYRDYDERPKSSTSDPRHSIIGSDDQDRSGDRRGSRRRRKRRESNATYDSDDSNDSGYDRQRRRRQAMLAEEPREPSPVSPTTKNRSSVLFDSSPSDRQILEEGKRVSHVLPEDDCVHTDQHRLDHLDSQEREMPEAELHDPEPYLSAQQSQDLRQSIFGGPMNEEDGMSRSRSPASNDARSRRLLRKISEDSLENSPLARKGKRDVSDVGSPDSGIKARSTSHDLSPLVTGAAAGAAVIRSEDLVRRLHKPSKEEDDRSMDMERSRSRDQDHPRRLSNQSNTSAPNRDSEWRRQAIGSPDSIHAIIRTPDQVRSPSGQSVRSSGTPPLRRVDRSVSGDLRGASMKSDARRRANTAEAEAEAILGIAEETIPSSSTYDPLTDKGKNRSEMADVYEGDGWRGQSPMSPTRPPSMRKRQSMQFADLEQRFEQLAADHRSLQNAKSVAERRLEEQARGHSQQRQTYEEAIQEHKSYLAEKDSELSRLHEILDGFKRQVSELTSVNEELQTSRGLDPDRVGDQSFQILAGQHDTTKRELEALREQHTKLVNGHEDMLEREIEAVRQEKDYELQQLQEELESAKEQVRALHKQIIASRSNDDYIEHDEDYFESKCIALCQHVQQWVLRFSKFSDNRACRFVGELGDDTLSDLFDDAILDGTEADDYLQDRIKRRDVLMSVVMSRIFDFIFRRYLFGLDREQRKKLKDLDANLTEVGPQSAVHKWRSTTLTLLSSRPEFADQREEDTEGVVESIFQTLSAILPPKKDLIPQITDSLRRVVAMAVDLHIEMRLQRAEFQMLPPLKPQFDPATGELTRKVPFNATMMNERSGATASNEQLQEEGAVVRMVLFPLVVKNSDEEEQIVVCPAQVLVAKEEKKKGNGKQVRVMSAQGARSEASFAGTEDTRMTEEGVMF